MVNFPCTDLMRAADMRRLCLVMVGIAGTAMATSALAQPKFGRAHSAIPKYDTLALANPYPDPYEQPFRARKGGAEQFPPVRSHPPVEPQAGFSIRAGRDNPGEPMTGGLKFRF